MLQPDNVFTNQVIRLTRQDCITYEKLLEREVASFVPFESHSLYFPQTPPANMRPEREGAGWRAEYLPDERKLLVPLALGGELLGIFQARGVRLRAPKSMLPLLSRMGSVCVEKLLLYKRSIRCAQTGLLAREPFVSLLEREMEGVCACLSPSMEGKDGLDAPAYKAGVRVFWIRIKGMRDLQRRFGFMLAEDLLRDLAQGIEQLTPGQAVCGRVADNGFALLLPEAAGNGVVQLAHNLVAELSSRTRTHDLTGEEVGAACSVGMAHFPRDLEGAAFERSLAEQARELLRKAQCAAEAASEPGVEKVLPFSRIIKQGGLVKELLPYNQFLLSIGRITGAVKGQRFLVWDAQHTPDSDVAHKAEVVLVQVEDTSARAELVHQLDPTIRIEAGDRLTLLGEAPSGLWAEMDQAEGENTAGLLPFREFLAMFATMRETCQRFQLSLVRLQPAGSDAGARMHELAEQNAERVVTLARERFGADLPASRFSLHSVMFFHADTDADELLRGYTEFCTGLNTEHGIQTAVGIAAYPHLNFKKADILENCRKALDYALLLPEPHVGLFDSLAQNISADKLFSQGDLYGALEEYKLALLADAANNLARNSLGICLARLGKLDDARRQFEEVIERDAADLMAIYNLGHIYQRLGEAAKARTSYERCLKLDPAHVFSLIRLGQMAEKKGDLDKARSLFKRAAGLEDGRGLTHRHMARLALKLNNAEEAREHLHQALLFDPKDALALGLLARLYLENGDDTQVAETLAKQSVAIRPEQKSSWIELSRIYDRQGRNREAQDALAKAASL